MMSNDEDTEKVYQIDNYEAVNDVDNEDTGSRGIIDGESDEESVSSHTYMYDSVLEQKNFEATPRSLMFIGAKAMYQNSNPEQNLSSKRTHHRSLSFAETVEPLTLTWTNISVLSYIRRTGMCGRSYKTGETRQILSNITGLAMPGRLLCIMGPSGCGKTTLLNVLNDRNLSGLMVEGDVRANGARLGSNMKAVSAFVQETDVFIGNLKVREHLWFHALMKMDRHFQMDEIETRIEELMVELGLKKCAETYIGVPGSIKGISGGEMKRLSFASELLTNPPVMFLDEPTSGLDSFMAENIIHTLKKMARKNKTILCTIHQPSSEAYALFDDILLLGEGQVVYMGSTKGASNFFKTSGLPCPVNFNPADHFVHVIGNNNSNNNNNNEDGEKKNSMHDLIQRYQKTEENKKIHKTISEVVSSGLRRGSSRNSSGLESSFNLQFYKLQKYRVGLRRQLRGLLWRHWASQARDTNLFLVRIGQVMFLSIMIGLLYMHQEIDTSAGQFSMNGAHFLVTTMMSFNIFFTVLNSFPSELPIFFREHSAGLYRVDMYFISRNITDLLLFLILPTILAVFFYGLVYIDHLVGEFFLLWIICVIICFSSVSMGYFVSTITLDLDLSLALSPPIIFLLMMSSGFLINLSSIPIPLNYLQYLSWFRYTYEILCINQWLDLKNIPCKNTSTSGDPSTGVCYTNGIDMLKSLQFSTSRDKYIPNFICLLIIIIVLRILSFCFLYLRSKETKRVRLDDVYNYEYEEQ